MLINMFHWNTSIKTKWRGMIFNVSFPEWQNSQRLHKGNENFGMIYEIPFIEFSILNWKESFPNCWKRIQFSNFGEEAMTVLSLWRPFSLYYSHRCFPLEHLENSIKTFESPISVIINYLPTVVLITDFVQQNKLVWNANLWQLNCLCHSHDFLAEKEQNSEIE